jgi:hypothetical protein
MAATSAEGNAPSGTLPGPRATAPIAVAQASQMSRSGCRLSMRSRDMGGLLVWATAAVYFASEGRGLQER